MEVMIMTFAGLLLIVVAMSVGVLLGRKPIKGSCGGMSALGMDTACDICGGRPEDCDGEESQRKNKIANSDLAYEAK
ncbi:MAG TPA: (Na+)-NQR maturation NqrM [Marinobacterium sp.]|nr:(Na+)-NQR maturation NqrM [Marinobacterium sp.]